MSILEHIEPLPPDPIFGLGELFRKDPNKKKVDLTVGIYHDEHLQTKTMRAITEAEKRLLQIEKNKVYLPIGGKADFIQASRTLVFGKAFAQAQKGRFMGVQSIGGTSALWIGGQLLKDQVTKDLYLSDPTWPNHFAIFQGCKMAIQTYPYYNKKTHSFDFNLVLKTLSKAPKKSVIVLHACCHNPTGCDLNKEEWKELSDLMLKRELIPFFDFAYQGFAKGIEEDAWSIRYFANQGHEMFVAHSFSKFFGLYGERVGALHVLLKEEQIAKKAFTALKQIVRVSLSSPPLHGASLIPLILDDKKLRQIWEEELSSMRERIEKMRKAFIQALSHKFGDHSFEFLNNRLGLFSMLGLDNQEVNRLIKNYSIYLTKNGRVNLTGLSLENIPYVVDALFDVIK